MQPVYAILGHGSTVGAFVVILVVASFYMLRSDLPLKQRLKRIAAPALLGAVLSVTLLPLPFDEPRFFAVRLCVQTFGDVSPWWAPASDAARLLNVLLMAPLAIAWLVNDVPPAVAIGLGLGLSLAIELVQALSGGRACAGDDVFDNLSGVVIAVVLWSAARRVRALSTH